MGLDPRDHQSHACRYILWIRYIHYMGWGIGLEPLRKPWKWQCVGYTTGGLIPCTTCTRRYFCVDEVFSCVSEHMWVWIQWATCEHVCRNLGAACLVTSALQRTAACPPVCHIYPARPRQCRPRHNSPQWTPEAPTVTQQQEGTKTHS